jgi:hypothetical protein
MAITIPRTAWIDDDGTGTTGTVLNNAVKTELYNQIDAALGATEATINSLTQPPLWNAVAYNAANFVGVSPMTWTVDAGDQIRFSYRLNGKTMDVSFYVDSTTFGGTASSEARIVLPAGQSGKAYSICGIFRCFVNNVPANSFLGVITAGPSLSYLSLGRIDGSVFPLGANLYTLSGTATFEVN